MSDYNIVIKKIGNFIYSKFIKLYRLGYKIFLTKCLCNKLGSNTIIECSCKITGGIRIVIGRNVYVGRFCHLKSLTNQCNNDMPTIVIGNNVIINDFVIIDANLSISIADKTIIGPYSFFVDNNHNFENVNIAIQDQGHKYYPIVIEENVWVGAHVVVLPGVRIGRGSVIGANSTVTKDIPPYSLALGSPAKVVKRLLAQGELCE